MAMVLKVVKSKPCTARGLIGQAHAAGCLVAQVDADTEKVCGASGFTTLATDAIFSAGGGGNLPSLATIPGNHLQHIQRAGAHTLGAANAGVVDLDAVGHTRSHKGLLPELTQSFSAHPQDATITSRLFTRHAHGAWRASQEVHGVQNPMGKPSTDGEGHYPLKCLAALAVPSPMSDPLATLEQDVIDIVSEVLSVSDRPVTQESHFQNDLGADSLDTVELVMALEEKFEIDIPDEAAEGITTVGEAVAYIREQRSSASGEG